VDAGATWPAIDVGIPGAPAFIRLLAIDPADPSTIYAVYGAIDNRFGVVRSADGGQSWCSVELGFLPKGFPALAVSPTAPSTLYAGYFDPATQSGSLQKSTDGGQSWKAASAGLTYIDVRTLAIDPAHATTVYAGGTGGLYRTADSGASWKNLSSLQIAAVPFAPEPIFTNLLKPGPASFAPSSSTPATPVFFTPAPCGPTDAQPPTE
jgi:hypothetical protein